MPESTPAPTSARAPAAAPSFSPLYQQIKNLIVGSLRAAEWRPGESIPSEVELAARYGVSQGTVRKAIDDLAAENLLVRRQGKGTFVASHAEKKVQYRFLRLVGDDGTVTPFNRRFIDCRRMRAPAEVAQVLQLKPGESVVEIRRVLSTAEAPVVLDDIWLPSALFKGLTAERLSQYKGPMYALFESEFGVRMIRATERIRAVAADADAELLGVTAGTPLLSVERLSFTYGDVPVEFRRGLYRTDTHHYRNELN